MNESQDCPKIPREPIDKLTNTTWRYNNDNCSSISNLYTSTINPIINVFSDLIQEKTGIIKVET